MNIRINQLTHFLLIFLFFLLLSSLFFWKIVFLGEVLFFGDNLLHIGPNMQYWKDSVTNGTIPLWNPYILSGIPHLANPATNTLTPFNLVFFLFDNVYSGISFLIVNLIAVSGLGMYGFLKSLKLSLISCITGGIIFAFSGSLMADINDLNLESIHF